MNLDLDLLNRWRNTHDAAAFTEIVRRHGPMVYATCLRLLHNPADAEDTAQDCFLHLAQTRAPVSQSLGGWLHTLAHKRSLNRLRANARRAKREHNYGEQRPQTPKPESREMERLIDACIEELPHDLREIVVAYFLQGVDQPALAGELGVSQSTISRRANAGVAAIRKSLARRGLTVPASALIAYFTTQSAIAAPPALVASLGKVAIGGNAAAPAATAIGGVLTMKKIVFTSIALIAVAILAIITAQDSTTQPNETITSDNAHQIATNEESSDNIEAERDQAGQSSTVSVDRSSAPEENLAAAVAFDQTHVADLGQGDSAIAGVVVWKRNGEPCTSCEVQLRSAEIDTTLTSSFDGEFQFQGLAPADYWVAAESFDALPFNRIPVTIEAGETIDDIRIELSRGGSIVGDVYIGGELATNAHLVVQTLDEAGASARTSVETDNEGRFALDGVLDGERTIRGIIEFNEHTELWSNVARVHVDEGGAANVRLAFMAGAAAIEGLILVNGEPAPNQDFGINFYSPDGTDTRALVRARTDDTGAYRIEGIEEGPASLHAYIAVGRTSVYSDPVIVDTRGGDLTTVDFEFERGDATVQGRITRGGEPQRFGRIIIAGQVLKLDGSAAYELEGVDADKTGFSPSLYAGTGKIYTTATTAFIPEGVGPHTLDFDFPAGNATVKGYVLDEGGNPVTARVVVSYHDDAGREWFHTANANDDGQYTLEALPAQAAVIMLYLPGQEAVPVDVTPIDLIDSTTTQHDIYIPTEP